MRSVIAGLALLAAQSALADEPRPVCRAPSVIAEMQRQVRLRHPYARIDGEFVTERPTATPNVLLCQALMKDTVYDADVTGHSITPHVFEVRILPAGFVVRDLG